MHQARITKYKLNPDKTYLMTKLHPNGKMEPKGLGSVGWEIELDKAANVGSWYTSPVQDIILIGKGLLIETLNSTYIIEEFNEKASSSD